MNAIAQYIEEQIVLINARNNQYIYVQGMLAVACLGESISNQDKMRLHNAAKDALAGYANELDFYADAMARRVENDKAMFAVIDDSTYITPACPSFEMLQGRKANEVAACQ